MNSRNTSIYLTFAFGMFGLFVIKGITIESLKSPQCPASQAVYR